MRFAALVWDRQNLEHIARHQVHQDEIEEVLGRYHQIRRSWKGRYTIRGQTYDGRYLFVVLDALPQNRAYVVSAREMTDGEKSQFRRFL